MDAVHIVDPRRCPLCGSPNLCAMERQQAGAEQAPCWCTREKFGAQLLQQLPQPLRGKACICQNCVKAAQTPA